MKLTFIDNNQNDKVGSYRIWVRDLSQTLAGLGHDVSIQSDTSNVPEDADTVIFSKSTYQTATTYKKCSPHVKIGAINLPCNFPGKNIDFVIAGSYEERVSLSSYDHVFVYPLIERKFMNLPLKIHNKTEKIRLCFHGHYPHLFKFFPYLKIAIEKFSTLHTTELILITGHSNFTWTEQLGMPQGIRIERHPYDDKTFSNLISSCDIGLVPNISDLTCQVKDLRKITSVDCGLYDTDYFLRFKNKTNLGRAYVFYQHGIPVIHDLSPSSFDFMGRSGHYVCAHDHKSWLRELKKLSDPDYRQSVSDDNKKIFERDFNPVDHAKMLVDFIREI